MKAIDVIRNSLEFSEWFAGTFFEDMRDEPLVQPTAKGGNHPLWIIGHVAWSEGLLTSLVSGGKNPLEGWTATFGAGTQPIADAGQYPGYDEVLAKYHETRAGTLKLLDEVADAGLDDKPKVVPEGLEDFLGSNAKAFMAVVTHEQFHMGQFADARRVAGRKPLLGAPPAS